MKLLDFFSNIRNWLGNIGLSRADKALLNAAISGRRDWTLKALARGANINARHPKFHRTPLGMACWKYTHGRDYWYDSKSMDVGHRENVPQHLLGIIKLLIEKGAKFGGTYMPSIFSESCDFEVRDAKSEVLDAINEQLIKKANAEDIDGVKDLLDNGANYLNALLEISIEKNMPQMAVLALQKTTRLSSPHLGLILDGFWDHSLFFEAAKKGRTEIIKAMLDSVMNENTKNKIVNQSHGFHLGWTPLISAAASGHAEVVELLIRNGANVFSQTRNEGMTALNFAAESGYTEVVKHLIQGGANVNHEPPYSDPFTPLVSAAKNGHFNVVEELVHAGANLDFRVPFSMEASSLQLEYYFCLSQNRSEAARKVKEKLDAQYPFVNKTALEIADQLGHRDIAQFLRQNGAEEKTKMAACPCNKASTPELVGTRKENTK